MMKSFDSAESPESGYRSSSPQIPPPKTFQEPSVDERAFRSVHRNETFNLTSSDFEIRKSTQNTDNDSAVNKNRATGKRNFAVSDCPVHRLTSIPAKLMEFKSRNNGKHLPCKDYEASPVSGLRILSDAEFQQGKVMNDENKTASTSNVELKPTSSGRFLCHLCLKSYDDALSLAQHKCPRIENLRYPCEECGKIFGCPANRASHERWHKPKEMDAKSSAENKGKRDNNSESTEVPHAPFVKTQYPKVVNDVTRFPTPVKTIKLNKEEKDKISTSDPYVKAIYPCPSCKRRFRRESNRRKHAHVKHGIVHLPKMAEKKMDTWRDSMDDSSSTGSSSPDIRILSPFQLSHKSNESKPASSIATPVQAAEVLNKQRLNKEEELAMDLSPSDRWRSERYDEGPSFLPLPKVVNAKETIYSDEPLDLSKKSTLLPHNVARLVNNDNEDHTQHPAQPKLPPSSLEVNCRTINYGKFPAYSPELFLPLPARFYANPSGLVAFSPMPSLVSLFVPYRQQFGSSVAQSSPFVYRM
ncbi:unnamed protein product [Clavelina lepadiformis]|uniref:C2H2-type domain-containing protein n=1 Tax=Clavelina lepadiformis TaxID=159417 RepID=A0ABP0GSB6_CLALP